MPLWLPLWFAGSWAGAVHGSLPHAVPHADLHVGALVSAVPVVTDATSFEAKTTTEMSPRVRRRRMRLSGDSGSLRWTDIAKLICVGFAAYGFDTCLRESSLSVPAAPMFLIKSSTGQRMKASTCQIKATDWIFACTQNDECKYKLVRDVVYDDRTLSAFDIDDSIDTKSEVLKKGRVLVHDADEVFHPGVLEYVSVESLESGMRVVASLCNRMVVGDWTRLPLTTVVRIESNDGENIFMTLGEIVKLKQDQM